MFINTAYTDELVRLVATLLPVAAYVIATNVLVPFGLGFLVLLLAMVIAVAWYLVLPGVPSSWFIALVGVVLVLLPLLLRSVLRKFVATLAIRRYHDSEKAWRLYHLRPHVNVPAFRVIDLGRRGSALRLWLSWWWLRNRSGAQGRIIFRSAIGSVTADPMEGLLNSPVCHSFGELRQAAIALQASLDEPSLHAYFKTQNHTDGLRGRALLMPYIDGVPWIASNCDPVAEREDLWIFQVAREVYYYDALRQLWIDEHPPDLLQDAPELLRRVQAIFPGQPLQIEAVARETQYLVQCRLLQARFVYATAARDGFVRISEGRSRFARTWHRAEAWLLQAIAERRFVNAAFREIDGHVYHCTSFGTTWPHADRFVPRVLPAVRRLQAALRARRALSETSMQQNDLAERVSELHDLLRLQLQANLDSVGAAPHIVALGQRLAGLFISTEMVQRRPAGPYEWASEAGGSVSHDSNLLRNVAVSNYVFIVQRGGIALLLNRVVAELGHALLEYGMVCAGKALLADTENEERWWSLSRERTAAELFAEFGQPGVARNALDDDPGVARAQRFVLDVNGAWQPVVSATAYSGGLSPGGATGQAIWLADLRENKRPTVVLVEQLDRLPAAVIAAVAAVVCRMGTLHSHTATMCRRLGVPVIVYPGPLADLVGKTLKVDGETGEVEIVNTV